MTDFMLITTTITTTVTRIPKPLYTLDNRVTTTIWSGPTPPTASPLDQFEIRDLIALDFTFLNDLHLSLTNIGLYLTLAISILALISLLASNYQKIVSHN